MALESVGGIAVQWRLVKDNAAMALGDGRMAQFWLDQWAEPSPLLILATQYVPAAELEKWVHEYWNERGGGSGMSLLTFSYIRHKQELQHLNSLKKGWTITITGLQIRRENLNSNLQSVSIRRNLQHYEKKTRSGYGRLKLLKEFGYLLSLYPTTKF